MKSEERHQLEQNELADGVARLIQTVRPYLAYVFIAALAIIGAVVGYTYWTSAQARAEEEAWREFMAATDETQFETLISRYPNSKAVPYARLRVADYKFEQGRKALLNNHAKAIALLDQAVKIYDELAQAAPVDVKEQALFCMGMAIESKSAVSEAKGVYERVVSNFPGSEWAMRAQSRIQQLDTPQAKEFYAALTNYKPITASTDLPPLDKDAGPPPAPPGVTPPQTPTDIPAPPDEPGPEKAASAPKTEAAEPAPDTENTAVPEKTAATETQSPPTEPASPQT